MEFLLIALWGVAVIVSFVCLIIVIAQMFKHGETTMGVVCIVLAICTGLGMLIAYVYGWVKSREWQLTNVMLLWTVAWVVSIALWFAVVGAMIYGAGGMMQEMQNIRPVP